jgi:DNA polymerase
MLERAAATGEDLQIEMPSGSVLTYKKCRYRRVPMKEGGGNEIVAEIMRNGMAQTTRLWPSVIYENLCQKMARDCFAACLLRLHEEGYRVALHVHDEAVVEVPEADAEYHRSRIEELMSVTPAWAPGLPVAAEATIAKRYSEAK